jgi:membrane fusion protein, multidrug efflux system
MTDTQNLRRPRPRRVLLALCGVAVGAITLAAFGITDRARSRQEVADWTNAQAEQTVRVVQPKRGPAEDELVLPGTVQAFNAGALYARASGYVAAWNKDIGAHVNKGDVLATISAPDLDQQFAEAQAQLVQLQAGVQQAQANADLGAATDKRTAQLVAQGWTSKEQGDTDRLNAASRAAALAVAKANVATQQAVVNRLAELTKFEQITAPFDGVVTARNVQVGDLVTAGSTAGHPLFQVADLHRMRIYVDVPQAFLSEIKTGTEATLRLPGASETFPAKLETTANAVVEGSRTAQVELQADNPGGKLWPGAFTEVQFHIPSDPNILRIPATALVFGTKGMQVAQVDDAGRVRLKPITLGRNLGADVEVQSGLTLADRLVDNPLESTQTGDTVQVADGDRNGVAVAATHRADPEKPVAN